MISLIIPVTLTTLITSAIAANIALQDICGNKLVGSCPDKISLKVVGGDSSCAEKVPWNVLVELVTGPKIKAAGKVTTKVLCEGGSVHASLIIVQMEIIHHSFAATFVKST